MTAVAVQPTADALRPFVSPAGAIAVLALDHRDALRNAYKRIGIADVSEGTMVDVKVRVADAIGDLASALLLDERALARCRRAGAGVLLPLEEQGYEPRAGGRLTPLLAGFGPAEAKVLGADGCKLLLWYRADHAETAGRQRELVVRAAQECRRHGLALVVEPLVHRLEGEAEDAYARAFGELVVAAAQDLSDAGPDLLKLQYPGDAAACERAAAAAAPLPWTLLGGSEVDGETFAAQLEIACAAGACGFIAGRAIWGGALPLGPAEQDAWLAANARPLMQRLVEIADTHARRHP
jgi:tagatose-1,6-bisphosphate aldolase